MSGTQVASGRPVVVSEREALEAAAQVYAEAKIRIATERAIREARHEERGELAVAS